VLLILRALVWLITPYRRWLSGRGPLRRVQCSFAAEESCSTYGLRIAREAKHAREAIGRISRRLRRCREACIVRDGRRLTWATIHDRPPGELIAEMQRDGELDLATARMLTTRRAIALHRGDAVAVDACAAALPGKPRVVVRQTRARRWRHRIVVLACLVLLPLFGLRGLWR
jgi:putative component of membrane protein insertase Oxa1/YidC/SpoIIIJ protein YidD